jgi:hypothetical protein
MLFMAGPLRSDTDAICIVVGLPLWDPQIRSRLRDSATSELGQGPSRLLAAQVWNGP